MTLADVRMSAGLMVGEVCHFYGWTVEYVLAMPASRFFLMLESGRKIKAQEYQRLCYISRSSQMVDKAFQETVAFFGGTAEVEQEPKILPPKPLNAPKPIAADKAGPALMAQFAKDKRINRMQRATLRPKKPGGVDG
jgi:hypothetical protein